jgi:hypothetical protein
MAALFALCVSGPLCPSSGEREHHEADEMKSIPAAHTVALALAALLLAFTTTARSSNMVVYRCLDGHLGVVYTDVPCKEGQGFET